MSPGILAQSVLFGAIFYGISLIWSAIWVSCRISGQPRASKRPGAGSSHFIDGSQPCQMIFVYVIAFLLHVELRFEAFALAGVVLAVIMGSGNFLHIFVDCCLRREIPRALHGNRTGFDHAPLFCQQCNLPTHPDAGVAARRFTGEPPNVSGGRASGFDGCRGRDFDESIGGLPCDGRYSFAILVAIATRLYPTIVT